MKYWLCCWFSWWIALTATGQAPATVSINDDWQFTKEAVSIDGKPTHHSGNWQLVQLPHTWNATDVMDDVPGYYRGPAWYKKDITIPALYKDATLYLFFEGANQVTDVYIDGKKAGYHTGGYTNFYIPVSQFLDKTRPANVHEVMVKVDNSANNDIPPLSADFTFYGGLYRDVYLVALNKVHIKVDEYGTRDLFITTPSVDSNRALVQVRGMVLNHTAATQPVRIVTTIYDQSGNAVVADSTTLKLAIGKATAFTQQLPAVTQPHLWSTDDPYLYRVETTIKDAAGKMLDQLTNPLGFRWFRFDAAKGFFLNGQPCKLVGASRHQDYEGMGNAVPASLAVRDMEWLKEMGGNFLRVAHYPQHSAVLQACDRLGILASVEIPVVNEITESDAFNNNCAYMLTEMIRQQFNHPSVIIWAYMNEILLKPHFNNDSVQQRRYFARIEQLAKKLDSLARKEDPSRYTMLAHHGDFAKYQGVGLNNIAMVLGWNLYPGWYGGQLEDFPAFLDRHHQQMPGMPLLVTEYGADADPRIRSLHPVRFDKSVEYTTRFHQYYMQEMMKRPFVAAAMIWNLADFNSETRVETMPHINNKGLLRWDRRPKDPYYLYQSWLKREPVLKILAASWPNRSGMADSLLPVCYQPVQVASNLDSVELWMNGVSLGRKKVIDHLVEWRAPYINGSNLLEVRRTKEGQSYTDKANLECTVIPYTFNNASIPFTGVNILLGANRYYLDEVHHQCWIPSQPYRSGSFGSIGGKTFTIPNNGRLPYGSDKSIAGTDNDPVYQTQQIGIEQYRFDVPAGVYEMTLHFAELQGGETKPLPYNLYPSPPVEMKPARIFNVYVNDQLLLEHFNIAAQCGIARAVAKKTTVTVKGSQGIRLSFRSITGEPVLNALQLTRLY